MSEKIFLYSLELPGLITLNLNGNLEGILLPKEPNKHFIEFAKEWAANNSNKINDVVAIVSLLRDQWSKDNLQELKNTFPNISVICNYAVGYNNINVEAAKELNIRVTNTPEVLVDATANVALTLLLMVSRRVKEGLFLIEYTGGYPGWAPNFMTGISLEGKTLGIVGLGDIGTLFAQRAENLGMKVVALESLHKKGSKNVSKYKRVPEQEFFSICDVISIHSPLTAETNGWMNRDRIFSMKKGAILINTSRGEVIDEEALKEALNSNHLFGAGIDVFCGEPKLSEHLRSARNLTVLPHIGSATVETRIAMGERTAFSLNEAFSKNSNDKLTFQVN